MTELDKWANVADSARILFEFSEHYPEVTEDMIYAFFGIDVDKLEQERRELLESIQ